MVLELRLTLPVLEVRPLSASVVAPLQTPYTLAPWTAIPLSLTTVTAAIAHTYPDKGTRLMVMLLIWSLPEAGGNVVVVVGGGVVVGGIVVVGGGVLVVGGGGAVMLKLASPAS